MPARPPIIDIRGLTVERGEAVILRDVDWRVGVGEHWAVVGANGSGKTSLLCALAGYMVPTGGHISVLGRTYGEFDWRELRRWIGMVSSNLRQRIDDSESAREVVASGRHAMLNFWGTLGRRDKSEAASWLRRVGCLPLDRRPWAVLSQGERQRVLIARALIAKPRLLILDEPCAGLDPVAREGFLAFVDRLGRAPGCPGLILVTHHVEEIMPVFSHLLVLKTGRVLAQGPIASLLNSRVLSRAFDTRLIVRRQAGRSSLRLPTPPPSIG